MLASTPEAAGIRACGPDGFCWFPASRLGLDPASLRSAASRRRDSSDIRLDWAASTRLEWSKSC